MSGAPKGLDVSSWQHPDGRPINWDAVANAGYRFAVVKATQGANYKNPWADRDLDDARAAGLLVGAYHYFEAGQPAPAQALNLTGAVANQVLDLGAWTDWECYAPLPYTHTAELAEFRAAVTEYLGDCGVYCDRAWADVLAKESVSLSRLWLAAAGEPYEGLAPLLVQSLSGEVPGVTGPVDLDILTSTRGVDIPTAPGPRTRPEAIAAVVAAAAATDDVADAPPAPPDIIRT